jgi:PAS domain S-box-containing protein
MSSVQPTPGVDAGIKQLAEAIHSDAHGMFGVLLRHSIDGITLNSRESRIFLEVSDSFCELTGYAREELLGRTSVEMGLIQADGTLDEVSRQADEGNGGLFERRLRRKDGSERWVEFSTQLLDHDLVVSIVRDVTGRRALEDLLFQENQAAIDARREAELAKAEADKARRDADLANKAKSEFLSRMSHELRTPLNAVLGFAQLLALDELTPAQKDSVDRIMRGGQHLVSLIGEVLDISRIETGDLAMSSELVNIGEVIEAAVELVRPLTAERSIALTVKTMRLGELNVCADRQRLKQILLNLLTNAIKYNSDHGNVTISCSQKTNRVQIQVADTGPGIKNEHLRRLFVPFDRLGADLTEIEGTGIGLSLSQHLAEAMGGRIAVTSTVGVGSTFWIDLPIAEPEIELLGHQDYASYDGFESTSDQHSTEG